MKRRSVLKKQAIKRKKTDQLSNILGRIRLVSSVTFKISLLVVGLAVISLIFLSLYQYLITSPYIRLEEVIITGANEEIKEELYKYWNEGDIVEMLGVISLFGYLNRWNDSMGTTLEERAIQSGEKYLSKKGWNRGKHV